MVAQYPPKPLPRKPKSQPPPPYRLYQGTNTNFCGYAALSWLPLHDDPLTYVRFLMTLYTDGHADWGAIRFNPSHEIYRAAGTLRFKGILDIRPADQLWFLILADHFQKLPEPLFPPLSSRLRKYVLGRSQLWQIQPHHPRHVRLPNPGHRLGSAPPSYPRFLHLPEPVQANRPDLPLCQQYLSPQKKPQQIQRSLPYPFHHPRRDPPASPTSPTK